MKKNIFKILMLSALSFSAVTSCELDLFSSANISTDTAFQSTDDAKKFGAGLHSFYRVLKYGGYAMYEDIQTDMFYAANNFGNNGGAFHLMGANFNSSQSEVRSIWSNAYAGLIVNANNFLDNVDKIEGASTDEEVKVLKGMAYFYRADIHFDVARRFCEPYDPATAPTKFGIPYITTVDPTYQPHRGTLEETYQAINNDLDSAAKYLANTPGKARANKPTIDAVKAVQAKVALYTKDYQKAADLSREIIESGVYSLPTDVDAMTKEWRGLFGTDHVEQASPEAIFQIHADMAEGANTMSFYMNYDKQKKTYSPTYIPTLEATKMYEPTDLRGQVWMSELPSYYEGAGEVNLILLTKFAGETYDIDADNKSFLVQPKVYRLGIMYLICAEANYALGNEGEAKLMLNALQVKRGATPTEVNDDFIRDEWRKETIGEGYSLDNIKRWGIGFKRGAAQNPLTANVQGPNMEFMANHFQFVWPIPAGEIQTNPNLKAEQNPGW